MLEANIFAISEESVQSSTTDTQEVDPRFSCFTADQKPSFLFLAKDFASFSRLS